MICAILRLGPPGSDELSRMILAAHWNRTGQTVLLVGVAKCQETQQRVIILEALTTGYINTGIIRILLLYLRLLFNLVRSAFASCPRSLNQSPSCIPSAETTSLVVDVLPQRSQLYFNPLRVKEEAIWDKFPAVFLHLKLQVLCTIALEGFGGNVKSKEIFLCTGFLALLSLRGSANFRWCGAWRDACCFFSGKHLDAIWRCEPLLLKVRLLGNASWHLWHQKHSQAQQKWRSFPSSLWMNSRVSPCSWIVSLFHSTWSLVS